MGCLARAAAIASLLRARAWPADGARAGGGGGRVDRGGRARPAAVAAARGLARARGRGPRGPRRAAADAGERVYCIVGEVRERVDARARRPPDRGRRQGDALCAGIRAGIRVARRGAPRTRSCSTSNTSAARTASRRSTAPGSRTPRSTTSWPARATRCPGPTRGCTARGRTWPARTTPSPRETRRNRWYKHQQMAWVFAANDEPCSTDEECKRTLVRKANITTSRSR